MFEYNFVPEDEIKASTLYEGLDLLPGNARFEVKAADTHKKNGQANITREGDPYLNLFLHVTDSRGFVGKVWDIIVSTSQWKILQFSKAVGKSFYSSVGGLDERKLIGCKGECIIHVQAGKGNYPDKMVIKSYIEQAGGNMEAVKPVEYDDEIPF